MEKEVGMAENLMNSAHKATNQQYRDNWDATFGKKKTVKELISEQKQAAIDYVKARSTDTGSDQDKPTG